ncbi:MAG: diacylglycerol/lipid kinase family protein [Anaerovoracaceae bacterium]
MDKKNLIIMNPFSGKREANKYLTDIIDIFTKGGYMTTILTTTERGDGTVYASRYAGEFDLITCIGGDGTFNEVVAGLLDGGERVPVGYIPAGSTNDFANSLKLSTNILKATEDIVKGRLKTLDIGSFNGRKFSYVASFGAFTQTSYSTPQSVKNMLGHLAYILEGATSLTSIKPQHLKIEANWMPYEDDYIFGAISNSTSLAGILTLDPQYVDMNDGLFELLLVRSPKNPIELAEIVYMLTTQNYESNKITFVNADSFTIYADENMDWSLDGEYQEGCERIEIENLHNAIDIVVNDKEE